MREMLSSLVLYPNVYNVWDGLGQSVCHVAAEIQALGPAPAAGVPLSRKLDQSQDSNLGIPMWDVAIQGHISTTAKRLYLEFYF